MNMIPEERRERIEAVVLKAGEYAGRIDRGGNRVVFRWDSRGLRVTVPPDLFDRLVFEGKITGEGTLPWRDQERTPVWTVIAWAMLGLMVLLAWLGAG